MLAKDNYSFQKHQKEQAKKKKKEAKRQNKLNKTIVQAENGPEQI